MRVRCAVGSADRSVRSLPYAQPRHPAILRTFISVRSSGRANDRHQDLIVTAFSCFVAGDDAKRCRSGGALRPSWPRRSSRSRRPLRPWLAFWADRPRLPWRPAIALRTCVAPWADGPHLPWRPGIALRTDVALWSFRSRVACLTWRSRRALRSGRTRAVEKQRTQERNRQQRTLHDHPPYSLAALTSGATMWMEFAAVSRRMVGVGRSLGKAVVCRAPSAVGNHPRSCHAAPRQADRESHR